MVALKTPEKGPKAKAISTEPRFRWLRRDCKFDLRGPIISGKSVFSQLPREVRLVLISPTDFRVGLGNPEWPLHEQFIDRAAVAVTKSRWEGLVSKRDRDRTSSRQPLNDQELLKKAAALAREEQGAKRSQPAERKRGRDRGRHDNMRNSDKNCNS